MPIKKKEVEKKVEVKVVKEQELNKFPKKKGDEINPNAPEIKG